MSRFYVLRVTGCEFHLGKKTKRAKSMGNVKIT